MKHGEYPPFEIGAELVPSVEGIVHDPRLQKSGIKGYLIAWGVGNYSFIKVLIYGQYKGKWFPVEYWREV